jgi:plasmid stabilization system protein ParE
MRSVERSTRGMPIEFDPLARAELNLRLLELSERWGPTATNDRRTQMRGLLARLAEQPRMYPWRPDLIEGTDQRVAWLGYWAVGYAVEVDSGDRAVSVTIHRVAYAFDLRRAD